jgi:hypothetical protein
LSHKSVTLDRGETLAFLVSTLANLALNMEASNWQLHPDERKLDAELVAKSKGAMQLRRRYHAKSD